MVFFKYGTEGSNSKKGDTLIKDNGINMCDYNFLNLDIQGAELLALRGIEDNLKFIDYIYTEVNTGEVYKNCAKVYEIDNPGYSVWVKIVPTFSDPTSFLLSDNPERNSAVFTPSLRAVFLRESNSLSNSFKTRL